MGNNQVVELQDEYSSDIQSKIFYNVGPDLPLVSAGRCWTSARSVAVEDYI
jgi:hypothetical protein